jgi:hypothetical protein
VHPKSPDIRATESKILAMKPYFTSFPHRVEDWKLDSAQSDAGMGKRKIAAELEITGPRKGFVIADLS